MIEVEHLTKYYGTFPVVRDVTFNVEKGEILGFLGPNGAGKTTTMRMITGYLPATSGTVRVAGFDVAQKSLQARQHLGYLPETVPLYTELTTLEYLDFRARLTGLLNARDRRARIYEVMDKLNLVDVGSKMIGALSRGYRQRVGLAQALLHNPDVLILDEPTVGLDPVQITEVRDLIKELGKDHTVILSTHLLPEVSMVCNRVIIINRGKLVAVDTPIHLAEGVGDKQIIHVEVGGTPSVVARTLRSVAGVKSARILNADGTTRDGNFENLQEGNYTYKIEHASGKELRSEIASTVVGAGQRLLELHAVRPTLEDTFIDVISKEGPDDRYDEMNYPPTPGAEQEQWDEDEYEGDEEEEAVAAPTRGRVAARKRVRR
jgi:ABC-2 type transport system ATP-binding protein